MSRSKSLVGSRIQVRIEKMVIGGAGLARTDGLVIFVDYAAPNDLLLVEIIEHKKNLAFGKIVEVIQPGPNRTQAPCQHYGICGGCSWQHISAKEQLKQKEIILKDALKEVLRSHPIEILPIIPSPKNFEYRNRVQMTFTGDRFAFRGKRSHDLVPVESCKLVEEPLRTLIEMVGSNKYKTQVRYDLRIQPESQKPLATPLNDDIELVGFSQVNRFQNYDLIQAVVSALKSHPQVDLYEFYAGSGNFTFPILKDHKFAHVWAIEGSPALVEVAHEEIQSHNISNKRISFHLGDVGHFLKSKWPTDKDIVFLDPPRIGADEFVIKTIAASRPAQIVYLSCHPVTLARDLKRLFHQAPDYRIDFIQPFEMFPQTDHIETLISLSR